MKKVLHNILSLLLTVIISVGLINVLGITAVAATTYSITELSGKYKTQGRTSVVDNTLMLDWSASGIEFNANCSGDVSVTVNTTRIKGGNLCGLYFTVVVDGVVQYENKRIPSNNNGSSWTSNSTDYPFHITTNGESTFVIAKNLKSGNHTFRIYNQTEANHGAFGIKSITLNGTVTTPPKSSDLYVEFVGDSIIAGLGNISKGGGNHEVPLYQDATRGWAYLTANRLEADWSVIARSGITAGNGFGWSGATSVSMQKVYPKTRYYSDKNTQYDFKRQPDVIVLGLGTNDMWTYSKTNATIDDVEKGFKDMLALIRSHNPKSKIVWVYGMMISSANDLIKKVVSNAGGSEKEYYTLELPANTSGGQGHPDINAQTMYAQKVTNFINSLLNRKPQTDTSSDSTVSSDFSTSQSTTGSGSSNPSIQNSSKDSMDSKDDTNEIQSNNSLISSTLNSSSKKENSNEGNADESVSAENSISTEAESTPNTDGMLKSLTVAGYKLSPEFRSNIVEYEILIPYDLTELDIDFETNSNVLKVEIVGSTDLIVGKNATVDVICIGEEDVIQTYKINVKRLLGNIKIIILFVAIVLILAVAIVAFLYFRRLKRKSYEN